MSLIAHTTSTGQSQSPAVDTTSANFLVAIANYDRAEVVQFIHDYLNGVLILTNTWTPLTLQDEGSFPEQRIYYCENPSVTGPLHTFQVDMPGGAGQQSGIFQAWSGMLTSGVFDNENGSHASSGESIQTGSAGNATDLIVAGWCSGSARTPSIDSGMTLGDSVTAGGFYQGASAYLIGASGAINPTWDWTGQGSARSAVTIAAFKMSGVTPPSGVLLGQGVL